MMLLVVLVLAALVPAARAHDVADQLRVHALVHADDGRLQVVVRVPLELLLNIDLPKHGNGYLDLTRVDEAVPRALQAVTKDLEFFADEQPLALAAGQARIALPSDRAFESFERARAAVRGERLPVGTDVYWNQGYFDALLEYTLPRASPNLALDFHVAPGLRDRLRLDLRYLTPTGEVRAYDLATGAGMVALDPSWYQAASTFVRSGLLHILGGVDHLLFLICLVLPFRRLGWPLVGVVTAFTVTHSITLIFAALGLVPTAAAFPLLVEVLIAASIIYMAVDNLFTPHLQWRWLLAAAFGLVHGFGFSFGLANELQFAGSHLAVSLLAFNLGIELGQLLVLAVVWPLLAWLRSRLPQGDRLLTAVLCGFVAHAAWHWLTDRFGALGRADWTGLLPTLWPHGLSALLALAAVLMVAKALRQNQAPLDVREANE